MNNVELAIILFFYVFRYLRINAQIKMLAQLHFCFTESTRQGTISCEDLAQEENNIRAKLFQIKLLC